MPSAAPASPPLYPLSLHAALPICAAQAQRDPARVQGPQRAAGRRLDRARHHQPADRADGARGRRAQGVPGLGRAAGALPEHLRHRRSEEHTSELQSPCNLVCRLLLPRLPRSTLFPYTPLFRSVRRKLNAIPLEFKDRNVLLVDDSIVRGTTSQQIVQMAREAGARKVYLASAAPPVRYPNIYGIDMPSAEELVAHGRTDEEVQQLLGCDWLIYQDLEDLEEAVSGPKHHLEHFDSSCFNGEYVTGIEDGYFDRIKQLRSDEAKKTRRAS